LVKETEVPGENNWPAASHWKTLYYITLYWAHLAWAGFELTTLVMILIGTDCIGSYKSNHPTITTTPDIAMRNPFSQNLYQW
jgi:hypothetical protein